MKYCSISEAAAKFNITEATLRYYEKKGLLPLIERDKAGRRLFFRESNFTPRNRYLSKKYAYAH
ncbi:MerR family DNA-binding transcriptional regulator [Gottfriedia acidiceleris]|uniref:MerR family DNA-binding transcriptional regulator n=1 Tax=Gottfriedia acidiceleris TaxID=371036 RepID=UPI002FFE4942